MADELDNTNDGGEAGEDLNNQPDASDIVSAGNLSAEEQDNMFADEFNKDDSADDKKSDSSDSKDDKKEDKEDKKADDSDKKSSDDDKADDKDKDKDSDKKDEKKSEGDDKKKTALEEAEEAAKSKADEGKTEEEKAAEEAAKAKEAEEAAAAKVEADKKAEKEKGEGKTAKLEYKRVFSEDADDDQIRESLKGIGIDKELIKHAEDFPEDVRLMVTVAEKLVEQAFGNIPKAAEKEEAQLEEGELTVSERIDEVHDMVAQMQFQTEIQKLHSDAFEIANSDEYGEWIDKQSDNIKMLATSADPQDGNLVLNAYKEEKGIKADKKKSDKKDDFDDIHSNTTKSKSTPRGSAKTGGKDKNMSEEEAFSDEFNKKD